MASDSPFEHLPDEARLWIFGASRSLTGSEEARLLAATDHFLNGWKAHGHPLAAARDWRLGRFLFVVVDEGITPPSGCSIDALVRALRGLERELEVEFVGGAPVWLRVGEGNGPESDERPSVERISREEFRRRAQEGEVDGETVVFDPALTRVGELRKGRWERPAAAGWHARLLA